MRIQVLSTSQSMRVVVVQCRVQSRRISLTLRSRVLPFEGRVRIKCIKGTWGNRTEGDSQELSLNGNKDGFPLKGNYLSTIRNCKVT